MIREPIDLSKLPKPSGDRAARGVGETEGIDPAPGAI